MNRLISLYSAMVGMIEQRLDALVPLLARFTFAATLLGYFWSSALTKLGEGPLGLFFPSDGAYVQIFPRQMEAVLYDSSQLGAFHWLVATAGMWAEFLLPALIVLGACTRLSALAMIGFVTVQTLTDLFGHGAIAQTDTLGAWFDKIPDSQILDQRAFWMLILFTLVIKGGGALSLDRILARRAASQAALA